MTRASALGGHESKLGLGAMPTEAESENVETARRAMRAIFARTGGFAAHCSDDFRWRLNPSFDYPEGLSGELNDLIETFGGDDATWRFETYDIEDIIVSEDIVVARIAAEISLKTAPSARRRAEVALFMRFKAGLMSDVEMYACVRPTDEG